VDDFPTLKWCPFPNCEEAVSCKVAQTDLDTIVPSVECGLGHRFCFGCSGNDHQPATCKTAKLWLKKCADDSETSNWIAANTKECPKCQSTIEKNGGCNHMTCRKCKYEVCRINAVLLDMPGKLGRSWHFMVQLQPIRRKGIRGCKRCSSKVPCGFGKIFTCCFD
jgi:hypothetical protein